jgi:hypothetical protein
MIQTTRGQHGELRFETMENQESWADLVDECLRVFTPWSTSADSAVLRRVDVLGDFSLDALGRERGVDRDRVETYRCHAFIDPDWYGQITEKLGLAPPREKLAVPRFSLNTQFQDYDNSGGFTTTTPKLTEEERRSIAEHLSVEAKRRQQFEPNLLKIVAHGREYARFHIDRAESHYCELPEGVKLIEVWVEQDGTDVLVGTHWVAYTEWQGIAAARATVSLMDGRELLLTITPLEERTGCASLVLVCRSVSPSASRATFETIRWFRLKPRLALLAVSLVALGWIAGTILSRRDLSRQQERLEAVSKELAQEKELRKALQHSIANEGESRPPGIYRLIPDDIHIRSSENAGATVVRLYAKSPLVILELPVADRKKAYRAALTPFLKQQEILRESFIEPLRRDEASFVEFSLPSSLVSDGEHYVISLRSIGKGGSGELYRTFTFLVVKK